MANNLSQRRSIENSYAAQKASNNFGRQRATKQNMQQRGDARKNFQRQTPRVTSNYASRGLGNSGVYKRALQQFTGDYADQVGQINQAGMDTQNQYDMQDRMYRASYDQALAELENQKAMQITQTAAGINSLRPLIG